MNRDLIERIISSVVRHYFESRDFNGYSIAQLKREYGMSDPEVFELLPALLSEEAIEIVCGNLHPNPYIKAFSGVPIESQLRYLADIPLREDFCLYPRPQRLASCADVSHFDGSPYSRLLALGSGHLDFRTFDISVLEHYRNDPRYSFKTSWIAGQVFIREKYEEDGSIPIHDKIFLKTFGFAFDKDLNRYVAVYLRYLHNLSPEHQQLWATKELQGEYSLHPDYYRCSIQGQFGKRISMFSAFLQELELLNQMSALMGRPPLFIDSFRDKEIREFGFLLRPTLAEFNRFVTLLDRMMSDNLNRDFFRGEVPLEDEKERSDGKVVVTQVSTIALLQEWICSYFEMPDSSAVERAISTFRSVRKARQKPAHAVEEDKFDQEYFRLQRDLIINAYHAVKTLRLLFSVHPAVQAAPPAIDTHLLNGEIWDI